MWVCCTVLAFTIDVVLKQRMARMSAVRDVNGSAASAALRAAYHDVTRKLILCKQGQMS